MNSEKAAKGRLLAFWIRPNDAPVAPEPLRKTILPFFAEPTERRREADVYWVQTPGSAPPPPSTLLDTNLGAAVNAYAAHERGTLEEVGKARNAAMTAQGPAQQAQAENQLSGALRQLFALSEAYPDLKANQKFQQLQAELSDIENKIAAARRFFNNAVQ